MDIAGKKVVLIGMGKTSFALARLLKHLGGVPFVSEVKPREECVELIELFEAEGIAFECGGHTEEALRDAHLVIPSPGVPPGIPFLRAAVESGLPLMSELEFASRFSTSTLIAVTGTNGKTTTTELIAHLFKATGLNVQLAGNNECPFSAVAMQDKQPDYVILEVSSYQLELVDRFRPYVAVVLNVSNDHLMRHGTMENYAAGKAKIFSDQQEGNIAIVNADDPLTAKMGEKVPGRLIRFGMSSEAEMRFEKGRFMLDGDVVAERSDSALRGRHNTENILAAVAVLSSVGVKSDCIQEGLRTFTGVEHRIELTRELEGVRYFNDSKATNLDSLRVALECFEEPVVLIAGGEGKGSDYGSLANTIKAHVKHIVALGKDAPAIEAAWSTIVPVKRVSSMRDAVSRSRELASAGDSVLLSPACASFDMYSDFEERGKDFKRCVMDLAPAQSKHGAHL